MLALDVVLETTPGTVGSANPLTDLEQISVRAGAVTLLIDEVLVGLRAAHGKDEAVSTYHDAYSISLTEDEGTAAAAFAQLICRGEQVAAALFGLASCLTRSQRYAAANGIADFLAAALPEEPRPAALHGYTLFLLRQFRQSRQVLSRLAHMSRKNADHQPFLRFAQRTLLQQQFGVDAESP
jgi:thioredoxin-like negative regulator of GroEL